MLDRLRGLPKRTQLIALGSAAALIIVCVVILSTQSAPPPARATVFHPSGTATVVAIATTQPAAPTVAPTKIKPKPTATPKPHPLPVPTSNPPPPPAPATPTPAPLAGTPTPCGTTGCPTPGPCQAGGPPYYITPTATPASGDIASAIQFAANRNTIPFTLQEAIAWQESGWQQNIVACDGGIGLMQLMPATVQWINGYYGANLDPYVLGDNARLGAGYIAYYYTFYAQQCANIQGSPCDWDTVWPDPNTPDCATVRDIVISVYNEGAGTMSQYGIINDNYVNSVLNLMQARYGATGNLAQIPNSTCKTGTATPTPAP